MKTKTAVFCGFFLVSSFSANFSCTSDILQITFCFLAPHDLKKLTHLKFSEAKDEPRFRDGLRRLPQVPVALPLKNQP